MDHTEPAPHRGWLAPGGRGRRRDLLGHRRARGRPRRRRSARPSGEACGSSPSTWLCGLSSTGRSRPLVLARTAACGRLAARPRRRRRRARGPGVRGHPALCSSLRARPSAGVAVVEWLQATGVGPRDARPLPRRPLARARPPAAAGPCGAVVSRLVLVRRDLRRPAPKGLRVRRPPHSRPRSWPGSSPPRRSSTGTAVARSRSATGSAGSPSAPRCGPVVRPALPAVADRCRSPVWITSSLHIPSQAVFPAAILVAVLRSRMWGLGLPVSRAVLAGLLTLCWSPCTSSSPGS